MLEDNPVEVDYMNEKSTSGDGASVGSEEKSKSVSEEQKDAMTASSSAPELAGGPLSLSIVDEENLSPMDFVMRVFRRHGHEPRIRPAADCPDFQQPADDQIALYDHDILQIVRNEDIEKLRSVFAAGRSLECCNRFGESLLHMACRRGFTRVVQFMVHEAKVSVRVCDDYGRLPMHDACWCTEPNFEIVELLIQEAPEQIFFSDVRGHTPFSYVRRNHWKAWIQFLSTRESMLVPKTKNTS